MSICFLLVRNILSFNELGTYMFKQMEYTPWSEIYSLLSKTMLVVAPFSELLCTKTKC